MQKSFPLLGALILFSAIFCAAPWGTWGIAAPVPENLLVDGIPDIPEKLKEDAARYMEFRTAAMQSWHPKRLAMLINTRFADANQLHLVSFSGGARKQLTFFSDPVAGGTFQPVVGEMIVLSKDTGGGEFYQLYRYDLANGRMTLLTDGHSRHTSPLWSRSGKWLAYSSTQRNGKDTDIYVMNPAELGSARLVLPVEGGGWYVSDWSEDESKILVIQSISINEARVWLVDTRTGSRDLVVPGEKAAYSNARFGKEKGTLFVSSDIDSEFHRLCQIRLDPANGFREIVPLTAGISHDVEQFELSPDKLTIAFLINVGGASQLRFFNLTTGKEERAAELPRGVISNLNWHNDGHHLGFTLSSAQSPSDAFSWDINTAKLERWTESETGGLNPEQFSQPELVEMKSFDGVSISAFVYQPPREFPGKRPVLMVIHGGPESQARPTFQGRLNYFLNEMGIALVIPNVRGSSGYGKTFLTLDNGMKREDSVRDIGTVLDWIKTRGDLDADRVAVMGGSYGGYMVLASMAHFADRLKAGIDIVGISNFLTFLRNTQDYRRDLRRVEYGDERDETMRAYLEKISPASNVHKFKDPLFVIQGKNDPRVPASESEQIIKALRERSMPVWYLMARDEGHGFAKKRNQDFQFLATILFLEKYLAEPTGERLNAASPRH